MTGWTQPGRLHHSRPRDCRAVRVFRPASDALLPEACVVQADEGLKAAEKPLAMQAMINRGWTPPHLRIVRLFMIAAGKARKIRWHDRESHLLLSRSSPGPASQETCHSCRAQSPTLGALPDASTEVVMADNEILASASGRTLAMFAISSLIPVLVTGIQPPRVRAMNECSRLGRWSLTPRDLGALDSCDIARAKLGHRNEGDLGGSRHWTMEAVPA